MARKQSTRSQEWASEGVMSKSAASRHWIEATAAKITELRERDLRKMIFFGAVKRGQVANIIILAERTCRTSGRREIQKGSGCEYYN